MVDAIGWVSSLILLITIGQQVHRQWVEPPARAVSKWLFIGQTAASVGFTVYSFLLKNWVFTITNGLLLVSAIVGVVITMKRHGRGGVPAGSSRTEAAARPAAS